MFRNEPTVICLKHTVLTHGPCKMTAGEMIDEIARLTRCGSGYQWRSDTETHN